jgi:hypothetical protein
VKLKQEAAIEDNAKIVIFVLSAQSFLLGHENDSLVETVRDFKLIRMRQQNNHLSHEIQTLFFLQFLLKKVSLDAKI